MSSEFRQFDDHGLPIPQRYVDMRAPDDEDTPRKPRVSQRGKRIVLAVVILGVVLPLVFGPQIVKTIREGLANSLQGRAEQKIRRHDFDGAIEDLNQAIAWNPNGWNHYEVRSVARAGKNDLAGSVEDLTKTIDIFNDAWNNGNHRRRRGMDRSMQLASFYSRRSWINVRLGNRNAAIDDANEAVELKPSSENLNTRAYARAVLKVDLEAGLKDVETAIADAESRRQNFINPMLSSREQMYAQPFLDQQMANFLDTRGYLMLKLERNDEALKDLNRAVSLVEKSHKFIDEHPEIFGRRGDLDELSEDGTDESLAVMYHHRGEIRQQMNQPELADKDIKHAELLGYDREKGIF